MLQKYTGLTARPAVDGLDEAPPASPVLNDLMCAVMALGIHEERWGFDRASADGGLQCRVGPALGPAMKPASFHTGFREKKVRRAASGDKPFIRLRQLTHQRLRHAVAAETGKRRKLGR